MGERGILSDSCELSASKVVLDRVVREVGRSLAELRMSVYRILRTIVT